ncbi:putative L-2,4-diaminobutyrate decarboxylase [hydrothermal vent metagenome]|uniref:Putative L-2,4-diaminobutyrate decarboxylase n=1 Tax=hydrothermal vent metagenome TaxID=652676 RepID=A0A3B1DDJ8_9ZZZZ
MTTPPYTKNVQTLCQSFPQPVSDRVHDAYFVFSFMRALDQVDKMKSALPLLGQPEVLDYHAAQKRRIAETMQPLENVTSELVTYLSGMFIWGHPRSQINVVQAPTIPSIIGGLLPSIYNPNMASDETARRVSIAEVEVTAMIADLVGYTSEKAGGVFTFGGTGTLLYGLKIGLEKALPGTRKTGLKERAVILCSEQAHYACLTAASWLGLGEENVIKIPTSPNNDIQTMLLEKELRALLSENIKVAGIVATMGTTDAFGVDDLKEITRIRDALKEEFHLDYTPHIHADAVIGWAWSVFNDYNFDENPLGFRHRTVRAIAGAARHIQHLHLADSLGIDYHKTGFAPYISSQIIVKDAADLLLLSRDEKAMPYLFQSGHYHPGKYTLETTRSGAGPMAALANLLLFGKQGFQSLLGHLITMAEVLREHLEGHVTTTVLNRGNFGPVTLFRIYPEEVDTFSITEQERTNPDFKEKLHTYNNYNRKIFEIVQNDALQGEGVIISLTDCYRKTDYGEPVVALKSYIMSPFSEEKHVDAVLQSLWKAQRQIAQEEIETK